MIVWKHSPKKKNSTLQRFNYCPLVGSTVPANKDYELSIKENLLEEFAQAYLELERKMTEANEANETHEQQKDSELYATKNRQTRKFHCSLNGSFTG